MESQPITDYERRRLENIKRNDEVMASLKLQSLALKLSQPKSETPIVNRQSLRTRHLPPDPSFADGLQDKFSALAKARQTPPLRSLKVKTLLFKSKKNPQTLQLKPETRRSGGLIDTVADMKKGLVGKSICLSLSSMVLKPKKNIASVMPGRILDVKFFPCDDRTMIVAGNNLGNIVFWNVDCIGRKKDNIHLYRPHMASISGISIQPFSKVFSSDYKGSIRVLDFVKESFDLIHSQKTSISSLSQQPQDTNSLYFGDETGSLNLFNTRVGKSSSSLQLHDGRINTIDFNSENTNLMVTSSSDKSACIWDLRQINASSPKELKITEHKRAVHSAYFSPTGSCLATTSFDNHVGVLSGVDFIDTSLIFHHNRTQRGITTFRGIWGWDDSYIFIGSMKGEEVDVISMVEGNTTSLKSSKMTAIPSRFAAHPYKVGTLAAATGEGEVYVWTEN